MWKTSAIWPENPLFLIWNCWLLHQSGISAPSRISKDLHFFPIPLGQKSLKPIKSFTVIWAPYFLKPGDLEFKGKVWSYLFFIWLWWLHQIRFIYKENNAINVPAARVFMKTSQILWSSPIKCNSVNLSEPNPYLRTCNAPKLNLWSWWKGFRGFFVCERDTEPLFWVTPSASQPGREHTHH